MKELHTNIFLAITLISVAIIVFTIIKQCKK